MQTFESEPIFRYRTLLFRIEKKTAGGFVVMIQIKYSTASKSDFTRDMLRQSLIETHRQVTLRKLHHRRNQIKAYRDSQTDTMQNSFFASYENLNPALHRQYFPHLAVILATWVCYIVCYHIIILPTYGL